MRRSGPRLRLVWLLLGVLVGANLALADDPKPWINGWMPADKQARLEQLLPRTDNQQLNDKLHDPRLLLYTEAEIPRAFQEWADNLKGLHSPYYNQSAGGDRFGNANREFPWDGPAGTSKVKGLETFKFILWPTKDDGKPWPVAVYKEGPARRWTFPKGTMIGEVLAMKGPDGRVYTFEMRVRYRDVGFWDVDVYRPFPTSHDLAARIKELRPDWEQNPQLTAAVQHLESDEVMPVETLTDAPQHHVFKQTAGVDNLADLHDDALVSQLLSSTPFRSALADPWRIDKAGHVAFASSTKAKWHIVPPGYNANFVAASNQSCVRCHDTTAKNASSLQSPRDWYGEVRGSDHILSFHPFRPEDVSGTGYGGSVTTLRPAFVNAGLVAYYEDDPQKFPASMYTTLIESEK